MNAMGVAAPSRCVLQVEEGGSLREQRDCGRYSEVQPMRWHVVATEPRQEALARQSLLALDIQVIMPMRREVRPLPRGACAVIHRQLWPGYLIAGWDAGVTWQRMLGERGIASVVHDIGDSYSPARLPHSAVQWLLLRMDQLGIVEAFSDPLPASKGGPPPEALDGRELMVAGGPFEGFRGVCEWSDAQRVGMLLDLLGGQRRVMVARSQVVAA